MRPGFDYLHATLLQGTAALNCKGGVIGGLAGGVKDTELVGIYIGLNAVTAATLTVTGMTDSAAAQQPWVFNGQIATDTLIALPYPILNEFAAFTFQPSVAGKIWVLTRAFQGGTD